MKKTQDMCEGWLQRARRAKMLAAQAKQLQEVKERCNQLDQAKRGGLQGEAICSIKSGFLE